jgi:hypothetical protein
MVLEYVYSSRVLQYNSIQFNSLLLLPLLLLLLPAAARIRHFREVFELAEICVGSCRFSLCLFVAFDSCAMSSAGAGGGSEDRKQRVLRAAAAITVVVAAGAVISYAVKKHKRATAAAAAERPLPSPGRTVSSFPTSLKAAAARNASGGGGGAAASNGQHSGGGGGGGGGDDDDAAYDDYPVNVGRFSVPVDTASRAAQRWFDRGLNWAADFHREEAA